MSFLSSSIRGWVGACTLLLALGVTSCASDDDAAPTTGFSLSVTALPATAWNVHDTLGVTTEGLRPAWTNAPFAWRNGTHFSPPPTWGAVSGSGKLRVYAPYSQQGAGGTLPIDLHDQRRWQVRPLWWAEVAVPLDHSGTLTLEPRSPLAKVHLQFSSENTDISRWEVALCQQPTMGEWNLRTGQAHPTTAEKDTLTLSLSAGTLERETNLYLFPSAHTTLRLRLLTPEGDTLWYNVVEQTELLANHTYTYQVPVGRLLPTPTPTPTPTVGGYVETPLLTTDWLKRPGIHYVTHSFPHYLRQVRNYEMLYDSQLKMAYWVSYPLCRFYTQKGVKRTDAWQFDPQVPVADQVNMSGYLRGYDRGHQIPSADRLVNRAANEQTFYYTNMTPQLSGLNQRGWSELEQCVRAWANQTDTLYVVTGAIPPSRLSDSNAWTISKADRKRIVVPAYYYKALCRLDRRTGHATTIAFLYPHRAVSESEDVFRYAVSVSQLEEKTGFTYFPQIRPADKRVFDPQQWRLPH